MVEDSILFDNCIVGKRAKVRRAILDKNVIIPDDAVIGFDAEEDKKHYHVTETGIVVIEGRRSSVEVASVIF